MKRSFFLPKDHLGQQIKNASPRAGLNLAHQSGPLFEICRELDVRFGVDSGLTGLLASASASAERRISERSPRFMASSNPGAVSPCLLQCFEKLDGYQLPFLWKHSKRRKHRLVGLEDSALVGFACNLAEDGCLASRSFARCTTWACAIVLPASRAKKSES